MKLGFLSGCLGSIPLEEKIKWASKIGFDTIEVSCWPYNNTRDYSGTDIDVENFNEEKAKRLQEVLAENNMTISSLAYYDNNLHEDLTIRNNYINHLKKVIDAANLLGVELVGTFTGRSMNITIEENFKEFERVFSEILKYASYKNVKIMIENCPMPGWNKDGFAGTISYSPELWDKMFEIFPELGLNFDPSHLLWLNINYLYALEKYKDKIFHIHAKDVIVNREGIEKYYGIYGKQINKKNEWDTGLFTYKMPGKGEIDWHAFFEIIKKIGYKGAISIEHEDPEYEGSLDKIKQGLILGYEFLSKLMG